MDEFSIIAKYFAPLAGEGAFGLKDDAAIVPQRAGHDLVVTTDAITEGVDFFAFDPADSIARKALRVNFSDLAAKGSEPAHYLVNLALPHSITEQWLAGFADGLAQDQNEFGVTLLGGDTGATEGPLSIAVTAFGFIPSGQMVRRSGAKVGDHVYVTGTIGDSGGGLAIFKRESHSLSDADRDSLIARYRTPQPPVAFAASLRGIAHASVDVSDGLIADLGHIASASGVRIVVEGVADKSNAVLGTVFYPEADKPVNLAEQLVTAGLARVRRCTGCRPRPGPVLSMWWRQRLRLA